MQGSRFQDAERPGTIERPLAEIAARALIASAQKARARSADSTQESLSLEKFDGDVRVVFNGKAEPLYYEIRFACVADQRPLYAARKIGGRWFVVHGGQEGPHFDEIGILTSADGLPLYSVRRGTKWFILLAHAPVSRGYDAIAHLFVRPKSIGAIARRGKEYFDVLIPLHATPSAA